MAANIEIILTKDVDNLGRAGDVVKVRPGYGRNYLFPRGLALAATRGNMAEVEHRKRVIARERARIEAEHKQMAKVLETVSVAVARKKGDADRIFGSVTSKDIAEALAAQNISIDRKLIQLPDPLRAVGTHEVPVRFSADITVALKVNVIGI
ncbi:MAG: 50S ribosomal protein L9 [Myxococcales bacterium]|nr:50S ribosomal protein L9 [Myxococcales bacterium]MCB9703988.1 50S ribosomal protein L9 [Myxococcales bacterium]